MLNHRLAYLFLLVFSTTFWAQASTRTNEGAKKAFFTFSGSPLEVTGHINSDYRENGPLLTLDGGTMFFSRSMHPENVGGQRDMEDIWYSDWNDQTNEWGEAVRFPYFNNEFPNFINSIAIDKGVPTLVLGNDYSNVKKMKEGLSYSRLVDGEWTQPVKYEIENFVNFSERVDYFVSEDASVLLFSGILDYNRYDRQIYVSEKIDESTWSTPIEIKAVNTFGDDVAPYMIDNKYLFFATDSLGGYGGKDIFVMKRLNELGWDSWSDPINLGPQINDKNDNVYFHYSKIRNKAYLTRGLDHEEMDIVEIRLYLEEELFAKIDGKSACSARSFYQNQHEAPHSHPSQKCFDYEIVGLEEPDVANKEFIWHFGDGTIGYGINTAHCYEEPGNYMVNFSLVESTMQYQFNEEHSFEVEVFEDIQVVLEPINPKQAQSPHQAFSAHLLNLPSEVVDVDYYWDFGDGNYDCGPSVEHDYLYGKSFEVTVSAVFELEGESIQLMKSIETQVDPAV
ncbi:MAG: PKD domain-containing protein [Bacteroidota bacterium]